jgi:hypothetical protein
MKILGKLISLGFIIFCLLLIFFSNKSGSFLSIKLEKKPILKKEIDINLDETNIATSSQNLLTASESQKLNIPVYQFELYSKSLCSNCTQVKEFIKSLSKENQDKIKIIEVDSQEELEILTQRVMICYKNPPEELETPFLFVASDNLCLKGIDKIIDYFSILNSVDD